MNNDDEYWMNEALKYAEYGMNTFGELPIAAILVSNGKELGRKITANVRENAIIAHAENKLLEKIHKKIIFAEHPLILYTTFEPCIMCIGAAIECGVDKIVYSLDAKPDGGACYRDALVGIKEKIPEIEGGLFREKSLKLMKEFKEKFDETNPAYYYIKELLREEL